MTILDRPTCMKKGSVPATVGDVLTIPLMVVFYFTTIAGVVSSHHIYALIGVAGAMVTFREMLNRHIL